MPVFQDLLNNLKKILPNIWNESNQDTEHAASPALPEHHVRRHPDHCAVRVGADFGGGLVQLHHRALLPPLQHKQLVLVLHLSEWRKFKHIETRMSIECSSWCKKGNPIQQKLQKLHNHILVEPPTLHEQCHYEHNQHNAASTQIARTTAIGDDNAFPTTGAPSFVNNVNWVLANKLGLLAWLWGMRYTWPGLNTTA